MRITIFTYILQQKFIFKSKSVFLDFQSNLINWIKIECLLNFKKYKISIHNKKSFNQYYFFWLIFTKIFFTQFASVSLV